MNDEVIDIYKPEVQQEPSRIVEIPRPLVPKRTIIKFTITDERDYSEGQRAN